MKNLFLMITLFAFAFASCNKDNADQGEKVGEVIFQPTTIDLEKSNGEKDGDFDCESEVNYVLTYIDGEMKRIPTFYIDGILYTQSIKMSVGTHTLEEFILMNNNGTPDDYSDDATIKASIHQGALFAELVSMTLNHEFTVEAFVKKEINVEVACVEESTFDSFGFTFFSADQITIRKQYFFGDVCVPCLNDFEGSLYADATGGIQLDMAAITKIEVYRNGEYISEVTNEDVNGNGVVCVPYADRLNTEDLFEFKMYVWLPSGPTFGWVLVHTYTFADAEMLEAGSDNVNEFVLGNCVLGGSELNLSQYINLPSTVEFSIDGTTAPSQSGNYFDITIDAPEGYSLTDGTYGGYCAQNDVYINTGVDYTANVYSSLNIIEAANNTDLTAVQLMKLHWLVNNLGNHGIDLENIGSGQWNTVQNLVWSVTNGLVLTVANQMTIETAMENGYLNYSPLPNQDEKVLLVLYHNDNTQLQIINLDVCE